MALGIGISWASRRTGDDDSKEEWFSRAFAVDLGFRNLHDYAAVCIVMRPMTTVHPIPASHPNQPPVRGVAQAGACAGLRP